MGIEPVYVQRIACALSHGAISDLAATANFAKQIRNLMSARLHHFEFAVRRQGSILRKRFHFARD